MFPYIFLGLLTMKRSGSFVSPTDGQTTCASKTALCTVVHRAVKRCPFYGSQCNYTPQKLGLGLAGARLGMGRALRGFPLKPPLSKGSFTPNTLRLCALPCRCDVRAAPRVVLLYFLDERIQSRLRYAARHVAAKMTQPDVRYRSTPSVPF